MKLFLTALLIVVIGIGLMALLSETGMGSFSREKSAFILWVIAAMEVSIFLLFRFVAGKR